MTPVGGSTPQIATTALEEYWGDPAVGPTVFLGPGCLKPSRRRAWEPLGGVLTPSRWDSPEVWPDLLRDEEAEADECLEALLPPLGRALDRIHGTAHSTAWWRLVVGPWLLAYIGMIQDRSTALADASEALPQAVVLGAPSAPMRPWPDFASFADASTTDTFNLLMYARVAERLGVRLERVGPPILEPEQPVRPPGAAKRGVGRALSSATARLATTVHRHRVVLHRMSHFSRRETLTLALKSRGRVAPLFEPVRPVSTVEADTAARAQLSEGLRDHAASPLASLTAGLLPDDVPLAYLEGFAEVGEAARRTFPDGPAAIFSLNAWYFDEAFRRWAADSARTGTVLLGGQHGGNYGVSAVSPSETLERRVLDRFYTWGWSGEGREDRTEAMPATRLSDLPRSEAGGGSGVLFVGTGIPRFTWASRVFPGYLDWQERFVKALPGSVIPQLSVRLYRELYGWEIEDRWREWCPEVSIQNWDISFEEALARCHLYVCDHLSTTYAQALAVRKPTILFWDPTAAPVRPEAAEAVDSLRRVGILHDSPEAAAAAVSSVLPEVAGWWNEPARQRAVEAFCERYARTADDALDRWLCEFDDVLAGGVTPRLR